MNKLLIDHDFVKKFRKEFPFFTTNPQQIYFDSSSTSLRPNILATTYAQQLSIAGNLERSSQTSQLTELIEHSNQALIDYLGLFHHLIWTSGATDSANFLASSLIQYFHQLKQQLQQKPIVIVAQANHHANILPWLFLAQQQYIEIIDIDGNLTAPSYQAVNLQRLYQLIEQYQQNLALIALPSVNNSHGIYCDLYQLCDILEQHQSSALLVVDHAQGITYQKQPLPARIDACFASMHKMFGPTGLGFLTVSKRLATLLSSQRFGGGAVAEVDMSTQQFVLNNNVNLTLPGTHNLQAIMQIAPLLNWWLSYKEPAIIYCQQLVNYAKQQLSAITQLTINPSDSFTINLSLKDGLESDLSIYLAQHNIITRSGKHCAYPWHDWINNEISLRLTIAPFNKVQEIEQLILHIKQFINIYLDE